MELFKYLNPQDDGYQCIEYKIPVKSSPLNMPIHILTRERTVKDQKVNLKDLVSHRHIGVDHTGSIKVWDAAAVLAYCLLNGNKGYFHLPNLLNLAVVVPNIEKGSTRKKLRVVELLWHGRFSR